MYKKFDIASIFFGIILTLILFLNQFMFVSESRVSQKIGLTARESLGANFPILFILTIILLILLFTKEKKAILNSITCFMASMNIGLCILFAGQAADMIPLSNDNARISMSIGCYLYIIICFLIMNKCNLDIADKKIRMLNYLPAIVISIYSFISGQLDGLSLFVEYRNRQSKFHTELINHITMVVRVIISAIVIGIPLGWIGHKYNKIRSIVSAILNTIEAIPSIAFIFLLIYPLSYLNRHLPFAEMLGISGFGAAPVFVALLFYALFQIVNNMHGALDSIDYHYIEVGQGMGMTKQQVFWKVELPLILPVIISGIRLSLTITIAGTALGAFAGYGGLGSFILAGSKGFAIDQILLGTFPILFMILISDALLRALTSLIVMISRKRGQVNI